MAMEEIIVAERNQSFPGILILDLNNKLLYSNQEALSLLKNPNDISSEIRRLCEQVKAHARRHGSGAASNRKRALLWRYNKSSYSLRAFFLGARSNGRPATHVMVLIESVPEQCGLGNDILQAHNISLIGKAKSGCALKMHPSSFRGSVSCQK